MYKLSNTTTDINVQVRVILQEISMYKLSNTTTDINVQVE